MPLVTTTGLIPNPAPASALVVIQWAVAAGTSDAITAAYSTPNTVLTDGLILAFRALFANATTAPTFSPDGLTAHIITRFGGQALVPGDIAGALAECLVRYNLANTRWELLNPAGNDMIGVGNNQQVLTSQGAGLNATWVNPARQLLNTVTASGSPSSISDITSFLDTRFNMFEVELVNVIPGTNAVQLQCTLQSGGVFQSSTYTANIIEGSSTSVASAAQTAFLPVSAADISNTTGVGVTGTLKIWNPQGTTLKKNCRWSTTYLNGSGFQATVDGSGNWAGGNGAITGIQFAISSGTIVNGSLFRVYGLT